MDNSLALLLLAAAVLVVWLWSRNSSLTGEIRKAQAEVNELSARVEQRAVAQFQQWRADDYAALKQQEAAVAERGAEMKLAEWKAGSEASIRADAIQRSQSVIVGKVSEHIVPHLPEFTYNPKDARFIGSPVDFIVFDGLDAGNVEQVVFIEVKTGKSTLNKRERQVRDAVVSKRVKWVEMRLHPSSHTAKIPVTIPTAARTSTGTDLAPIYTCANCGIPITVRLEDVERGAVRCDCGHTELVEAFEDTWTW